MMMFHMFNGHDMVMYSARTLDPEDTAPDNGIPPSPTNNVRSHTIEKTWEREKRSRFLF